MGAGGWRLITWVGAGWLSTGSAKASWMGPRVCTSTPSGCCGGCCARTTATASIRPSVESRRQGKMRDILEFLKGVNLGSSSSLANQARNEPAAGNLRGNKNRPRLAGNAQTGRYVPILPNCGNGENDEGIRSLRYEDSALRLATAHLPPELHAKIHALSDEALLAEERHWPRRDDGGQHGRRRRRVWHTREVNNTVNLGARPNHAEPVQEIVTREHANARRDLVAEIQPHFRNEGEMVLGKDANVCAGQSQQIAYETHNRAAGLRVHLAAVDHQALVRI